MIKFILKHYSTRIILLWFYNSIVARILSRGVRMWFYKRIFTIGPNSTITMGLQLRKLEGIRLGKNVNINPNCLIDSRGGEVWIGDYVDIAPEVNIWTLQHDIHDPDFSAQGADVRIENYCWVSSRATLLPGVHIKEGAVVASNAVVTKDVEPFVVVGGIPAKPIGERNRNQNPRKPWKPNWL